MLTLFYKCEPCDLIQKTKINRGLVLTKTNQNITYESSVINIYQQIERKAFLFTKVTFVTMTFDLNNTK